MIPIEITNGESSILHKNHRNIENHQQIAHISFRLSTIFDKNQLIIWHCACCDIIFSIYCYGPRKHLQFCSSENAEALWQTTQPAPSHHPLANQPDRLAKTNEMNERYYYYHRHRCNGLSTKFEAGIGWMGSRRRKSFFYFFFGEEEEDGKKRESKIKLNGWIRLREHFGNGNRGQNSCLVNSRQRRLGAGAG